MSGWRKRTIMEMARETHLEVYSLGKSKARFDSRLEAFAAMVREDEREKLLDMCKEGLWDAEGIRHHLSKGQA